MFLLKRKNSLVELFLTFTLFLAIATPSQTANRTRDKSLHVFKSLYLPLPVGTNKHTTTNYDEKENRIFSDELPALPRLWHAVIAKYHIL